MTSGRGSGSAPGGGPKSAQMVLEEILRELEDLVARRGVRTEEMIRVAGFFESAKALWLDSVRGSLPMPPTVLAHRLRVLIDICPPELREYRDRIEVGAQALEEEERLRKRA